MRKIYCWLVDIAYFSLTNLIGVSYPMRCGLHEQIEFISHKRESGEGREVNNLARPLPNRVGGKSRVETNDVKPCHPEYDKERDVRPKVVSVCDSMVLGKGC
jgi:hypothetical protein